MIISIINQKGGVGKTTVSTNIAVYFSQLGYKVLFVDADDQKSSLDWINSRDETNTRIVATHLGTAHLQKQVRELSKNYDVTIIDGKGIISEASKAAVVISDFFIVPVAPGTYDLQATEDFIIKVVNEVSTFKDIKGAILFNMMDSTVLTKDIENYIRTLDFPVFESKISRLTAYREAASKNLSILEYQPSSKAGLEFKSFFIELCNALGAKHAKKLRDWTKKGGITKRETSSTSFERNQRGKQSSRHGEAVY